MTTIDARGTNRNLPFATILNVGSSAANKTGSWRTERPIYVNLLPPCNKACPAGENIQQWLYHAEEGNYEAAWREIMANNPLPAVMGRVCYHECQTACNRTQVDEAVGINAIERFLGDKALEEGWSVAPLGPASGKTVLIVGAGPSGISAAYHLARLGHSVTVRDDGEKPGGMMRYGIPSYRLPRGILDQEIGRIAAMGVRFEMNTKVTDLEAALAEFDAVFLAVGAQIGRHTNIPAGAASHVLDAVSMLREVEEGRESIPEAGVAEAGNAEAAPAEQPQRGRRFGIGQRSRQADTAERRSPLGRQGGNNRRCFGCRR